MTIPDESLLSQMRAQIEATPLPTRSRRGRPLGRHPRAAVGALGTVAAAAVAIALLVSAAGAPGPAAAYSLQVNHDGSITFSLHDVATAIPLLNRKFRELGIKTTVIPITAHCHSVSGPHGGVLPPAQLTSGSMNQTWTYSRGGRPAPRGFRYVLAAKQLPNGRIETWIGAVQPPLPTCFADARSGQP